MNLSDLAAMGAQPAWCTLSLSLPQADDAWLDGFLDGFLALADAHGVALVGGDTTRGPLSVCVTVHGFVDAGAALRRDGARVGDDVWVSGTLGDAAGALAQWRAGRRATRRCAPGCDRPMPRVALGLALAGMAHAGDRCFRRPARRPRPCLQGQWRRRRTRGRCAAGIAAAARSVRSGRAPQPAGQRWR